MKRRQALLGIIGLSALAAVSAVARAGKKQGAGGGKAAAPKTPAWNDAWKRFSLLVWQYKTPPPGPEAKRVYDSLNLRGIHLDNNFSDSLLNFARENDYVYYVDHAAGKGDLHLMPDAWKEFFAKYRENRSRPERPRSLWDPAVRARLKERMRANIPRAKTGPALAYAFDDEISITSFTSPADVGWSPEGLRRFREWLKAEYSTLEALNREWSTAFARWEDVEPKGVDDLLPFHEKPLSAWNLAPWLDHRRFMDSEWADLLAELTRESNALDPTRPAGFVGGQAPATYGGFDYARLTEAVQWMEAYDIGASNEILRSFWDQSHPRVQTYFLTENEARDRWFLWYYLAHGCRGVICWPESKSGPWFEGGNARPHVRALAETFKAVQAPPASELLSDARFVHDGIGIYYSQPSIAVSWFMDIQVHGRTWPNRSSSMNNENATDLLNRVAWNKLLEDSGFQYSFVSYRDVVRRGAAALKDYKVLILPRTLALSVTEHWAIREWVRQGGTLIADHLPGIFDEHGRARTVGALDDVFGVARDLSKGILNGKTVTEVNAEFYQKPLGERLGAYDGAAKTAFGTVLYERGIRPSSSGGATALVSLEGTAGGIARRVGKTGLAQYENATPIPYLLVRATNEGEPYRARLRDLLRVRAAGDSLRPLTPRVRVRHAGASGDEIPLAERLFWEKNGRTYLFVVLNPLRNANISDAGSLSDDLLDTKPIRIALEFSSPVRGLRNERTGRELRGENGQKRFTDDWITCEANIYSWPGSVPTGG